MDYQARQTGPDRYGVVRVDIGAVVADGFESMSEAIIKEIAMNALVEAAKLCAVHDTVFYGTGRLCDGHHSKAQIREAYGATNDDEI